MNPTGTARLLPLCAAALLAGCAAGGPYPSLAPRAAEYDAAEGRPPPPCLPGDVAGVTATPTPAPAPAVNAALGRQVAALLAEARAGQSAFAAALPEASASAAKAGEARSENWVAAQQELSRLAAARTRGADALAGLDALAVAGSDTAASAEDEAALTAAIEEAQRLTADQQAELDRIGALLSPL